MVQRSMKRLNLWEMELVQLEKFVSIRRESLREIAKKRSLDVRFFHGVLKISTFQNVEWKGEKGGRIEKMLPYLHRK